MAPYVVGVRVLVIEDEPKMASMLQRGLADEGHEVDVAAEGRSGLARAAASPWDAVVLDLMLPDIDGFEVCRRLRAEGSTVGIVMLTARDDVVDRVRGLDGGADDYLLKPFSFEELSARLRAVARRRTGGEPEVLEAGDLRVDPQRRRAWRAGDPLDLSPRELDLLACFVRHAGQVLGRDQILAQVWHAELTDATNLTEDSNVVDQYVAYLRRKIDKPYGTADLQTVRGMGYRLSVPRPPC